MLIGGPLELAIATAHTSSRENRSPEDVLAARVINATAHATPAYRARNATAHTSSRENRSPEEALAERARNATAHRSSRQENQYDDYEHNVDISMARFWASNRPLEDTGDDLAEELAPITVGEVNSHVQNFLDSVDPKQVVYGCASCGLWVALPAPSTPFSKKLSELNILQLNNDEVTKYTALDDRWKNLVGVTRCANGSLFALYRIYLTTPPAYNFQWNIPHASVPATSVALLCKRCHNSVAGRNPKIPDNSIKSGVDFGLAWKYLPQLSALEKMLIAKYQSFAHVFKISSSNSHVGLKGSMVAMKSDANDACEKLRALYTAGGAAVPVTLPRRDALMQFQFLGPLTKWSNISRSADGRLDLVRRFQRVLNLQSDNLVIWLEFFQANNPTYFNIAIDQDIEASLVDIVNNLFDRASAHESDSMPTRINAQVQLNVPGAAEGADVGDGVPISGVFSYAPHGSQSDYNAELAADLERVLIQLFQEGDHVEVII